MYPIIISAILAATLYIVSCPYGFDWSGYGWSVLWAILMFAASMTVIILAVRKKLAAIMAELQRMMLEGRDALQRKMNEFQRRPVGDVKTATAQFEKLQRRQIEKGLEYTKNFDNYINWIPFLSRQVNITRMQFHYQLKEFKTVDALLPKCMVLDPLTAAMKIARMHVNKAPLEEIEAAFKKYSRRLRYNQSALLYSLMAWIYVRGNEEAKAHQTLVKACEANEHDTLKKNRDRLANGKIREFSNAGLGDEWYALFLEEPKMRVERRMPSADGRPF
ncbi:MAG: hypothetical protein FWG05_03715 [Kiritimatiellaeota bacterium]|nr:hypothetical protein [Kiritimatiellota bacterium]